MPSKILSDRMVIARNVVCVRRDLISELFQHIPEVLDRVQIGTIQLTVKYDTFSLMGANSYQVKLLQAGTPPGEAFWLLWQPSRAA